MIHLNDYFIVRVDEDFMKDGKLTYKKNRVVAVNVKESYISPIYLSICKDGTVMPLNTECIPGFLGVYHKDELDTEQFIADLEVYYNKLD